jgi:hypothetical protein
MLMGLVEYQIDFYKYRVGQCYKALEKNHKAGLLG